MVDPIETFVRFPNGDPHYGAIGEVATNWAFLERTVDEAIWELLQNDERLSACLTAQLMGFAPRMKALIALFNLRGITDKDHKALQTTFDKSNELAQRRNRIVHDPWLVSQATNSTVTYRAHVPNKLRLELAFIPHTLEAINKLAKEIRKFDDHCFNQFDGLLATYRQKFPEWRMIARSK
jgi:hypothetical protein